jgi:eukaryotic-like serine/threonine-protein kinase
MSETRSHTDPTILGSVLGSYRILAEITTGGMGTVFRAEHVLLGRPAAVKVLRADLTTSTHLVQRFFNEAKAVTACKHPGIVEVYDFGHTPDGHAFIAMELLEGEALGHRLARVRLTELETAAIAHGIASALKAAHKVGVIHRDLKPDNVFLVPDPDGGFDRSKVLDFGIAKLGEPSLTGGLGCQTQAGVLIGTPLYMAPEQAREAAAIDHRADLYSLGCILYHMLVGRPPFVADGGGEIIAMQMFGEVEPPSRLAAVSPEMEQLVLRLLEKEPARRFERTAEVVQALATIAARLANRTSWPTANGSTEIVVPPNTTPREDPARRKRGVWPLTGAAAVLVIAAGLGIGFSLLRAGTITPAKLSPHPAASPVRGAVSAPAALPSSPQPQTAPASLVAPVAPTRPAPESPAAVPTPEIARAPEPTKRPQRREKPLRRVTKRSPHPDPAPSAPPAAPKETP